MGFNSIILPCVVIYTFRLAAIRKSQNHFYKSFLLKTILQTERLRLREFAADDAAFILKLVNTPEWIEFIGNRKIHTPGVAEEYIHKTLQKSYAENDFGLWCMELKDTKEAIGMCGLVKRENLEYPDIGFAILPEYTRKGYTFEAAKATLKYAKEKLKLNTIVAITKSENKASIGLLHKLGMQYNQKLKISEDNTVLLFS